MRQKYLWWVGVVINIVAMMIFGAPSSELVNSEDMRFPEPNNV